MVCSMQQNVLNQSSKSRLVACESSKMQKTKTQDTKTSYKEMQFGYPLKYKCNLRVKGTDKGEGQIKAESLSLFM